jgi:TRAP-type C4-dicarboxylate transport system permease small subunit
VSLWLKLGQLITKLVIGAASVALLITMAMVVVNVCGRGLFASPIMAAVEIVGLAGVLLISFAIVLTERERAHIVVQMVTSRLPQRFQLFFTIFTFFLSLGAVALLGWGGILEFWEDAITPGATTYVLRISRAPFRFIWVVGCIVLFGFLLKHLIEAFVKVRKR